jgi:hypothetical protein
MMSKLTRRREVGEEECRIRIARKQLPAEQSGAAAELEHARGSQSRQKASQTLRHAALQIRMLVISFRPRAEALRDGGATV